MKEDIVIVGGGLSGVSLLASMAKVGKRAILLESKVIGGGGATSHSRGIVRVYDPIPQLMRYASEGLEFWKNFSKNHPCVFEQCGVAYFLAPHNVITAKKFVASREARLCSAKLISSKAIEDRCPSLNSSFRAHDRIAIWEENSGFINPRLAAQYLAEEALTYGSTIIEGAEVTNISSKKNYFSIETSFGKISASKVILANGSLLRNFYSETTPEIRSIVLSSFSSPIEVSPNICLIDEVSQSYLRPCNNGYFYVGGAQHTSSLNMQNLHVDLAKAMNENIELSNILLQNIQAKPIAAHLGHDLYTHSYLPILREPSRISPGVFSGFSGRGAKYIPALANSCVNDWVKRGLI